MMIAISTCHALGWQGDRSLTSHHRMMKNNNKAHKDEAKVRFFHEGLELAGIEHFFDRAFLKAGDIFP